MWVCSDYMYHCYGIMVLTRITADYRHKAVENAIRQTKEETISQGIEMEFRMPTAGIATVFQEILDDYNQDEGGVKPSMVEKHRMSES